MLTYRYTIAGTDCAIHYPQCPEDLAGFDTFLRRGGWIGWDTEGSGLDMFAPDHRLRLVQFGDEREAWVLRFDMFAGRIRTVLRTYPRLTAHNAPFDALCALAHFGLPLAELLSRNVDTRILAHLLDPRDLRDGGIGLRLKDLCVAHVDPRANEPEKALKATFRKLKLKIAEGFAKVPIDHPDFIVYAGVDAILAARLHAKLSARVRRGGLEGLSTFEHDLQTMLALIQSWGIRIDVPYTEELRDTLEAEAQHYREFASTWYGVANVNSTAQVGDALVLTDERMGEQTPTGKIRVDQGVLLPLADLDKDHNRLGLREPNMLADAVVRAKRAEKWCEAYARAFLALRDGVDHIHPTIGGLQARTGRMSVSRPPLQQLPTNDWRIRRAFIPDPGHVMIAVDYSQVEMRVLAALAQDHAMIGAILAGADLHDFTAAAIFGPGFTPAQRKIAKTIGFGKVYGGGAHTLSRQSGVPVEALQRGIAAYDQVFRGIKRYGRDLQRQAQADGLMVVTPWGRRLPLDEHRLYAATNYMVQSSARDLLAAAIVRVFNAGLGRYVLLPIHDELLGQAPQREAPDIVRAIGEAMQTTFYGVPIAAKASVYGGSWGAGYGAPDMAGVPA